MTARRGWLEAWELRAAAPAYAGWVAIGIGICFLGAATNTMVGWLYAIGGALMALLAIGALLPARELKSLQVRRRAPQPVSAGDEVALEIEVTNTSRQWRGLLELRDCLPPAIQGESTLAIDAIAPQASCRVRYTGLATRRGIYRWDEVDLRSGAPLGLFWSRRRWQISTRLVVYPTVLPLNRCPLLDNIGDADDAQQQFRPRTSALTTEVVRGLRPYRSGDPLRLVHWRSSARYGELRVRELETTSIGRDSIVGLDSAATWDAASFEQAAIAVASIYIYAERAQFAARFWSPSTGLVRGSRQVLETLAGIQPQATAAHPLPTRPLLWLTPNSQSLASLPAGSRWLLFSEGGGKLTATTALVGLRITADKPLQAQLQQNLS